MERYWVANGILASNECGGLVKYDDAQRALDAERARVKELEAELEEYRSIAEQQVASKAVSELATLQAQAKQLDRTLADVYQQRDGLQAQLADRDAMILQMGEQAAVLAKENMAVKAQLRQVEGKRDTARHRVDELEAREIDVEILQGDLTTLRQLVEALPVVDGRMDVECGACYYIRSFVAGQYGIVCGLITEQSTAMAIKALLEYRAALAAQDAGKAVSSG